MSRLRMVKPRTGIETRCRQEEIKSTPALKAKEEEAEEEGEDKLCPR